MRKTWKQLRRNGVTDAGRERVARLMRQDGLRGCQRGRIPRTTRRDETTAARAEASQTVSVGCEADRQHPGQPSGGNICTPAAVRTE